MAAAILPKGIAISFSNTPQANADTFTAAQSGLTEDTLLGLILLDVMANDLGGNAKSLYSLDDGVNSGGANSDLLVQDAIGFANLSAHGATIRITADGKVSYDASTLNASFKSDLQLLSDSEFATDTFSYAIRLGNGTLSWTTATVQIAGVNDTPAAANIAAATNEDTGNPVLLTASYTDVDAHDTHTVAINTAGTKGSVVNNGDGTFRYDPNGQFESLALGESAIDTFAYTVTDNHGASSTKTATVTIHGENDAPTSQDPVPTGQTFDQTTGLRLTAIMAFADVDLLDTHSVTVTPLTSGSIGTFTPTIGTDSTNSGHGSVGLSYQLTPAAFMAAGGHIPVQQDYLVTIDDHHGGTSSQLVSIPLAQILSGIGGGGGGGGTTTQPPVFTNTSPPNPFTSGQNLGQIIENPFVLQGPGPGNLFAQGTLTFSDPDGGNHHASVGFASVAAHFIVDSQGISHPLAGPPIIGTWQVSVLEPNQVQWTYTLPETAARSMSGGETLSLLFPVTVAEDGTGQSTQNVRIDLLGTDEATFLLAPNTLLTSGSDLLPYLLPPNQLSHLQTHDFSITENPSITGSSSVHHLSGTIAFVDPDKLDHPTVSMTVADMTHDLNLNPGDGPFNAAMQPLMAGFHYTVESFGNYGMIHWTYEVEDSALDMLASGSTLTASATFNIGALAGGPGGGGSLSTVNVNLFGANDAVTSAANHTTTHLTLSLAGDGTSGDFTFDDPDWFPDGRSVDFLPHNPSAHGHMGGGVTEGPWGGNGSVHWLYFPSEVGTLVVGQHDVWDVIVHDKFGSTVTHTLDFLLV